VNAVAHNSIEQTAFRRALPYGDLDFTALRVDLAIMLIQNCEAAFRFMDKLSSMFEPLP